MKPVRSGNQREKLITAAEAVVLRRGVGTLTLAAVAAAAKVSKGGLLYHFPSKEALIKAMVERLILDFQASLEQTLQSAPPAPGRFALALVRTTLDRPAEILRKESRMSAALLAAIANQPKLLEPVHRAYARWIKEILADGLPAGHALMVFAVLDGLWMWTLFGVYHPSRDQLQSIRAALDETITRGCLPTR